jgi:hypothetical protein
MDAFWDKGVRRAIRAWLETIFSTGVELRCELKSSLAVGNSTNFSALIGTVAYLHIHLAPAISRSTTRCVPPNPRWSPGLVAMQYETLARGSGLLGRRNERG